MINTNHPQVWGIVRMILFIVVGLPLAITAVSIIFALWLPLIPLWATLYLCHNADDGFWSFIEMNMRVMLYIYLGPVAVVAGIVSVCVNLALATPLLPLFLGLYVYYRWTEESWKFWRRVQQGLRMYFIGLCILVYAAPVISIAAAAAACVLLIQIIALPRNYFMLRDTESCDFFIDDCRSIFELFVNIIGTVPAVIVALATFPLVASLGVIHYLDSSV